MMTSVLYRKKDGMWDIHLYNYTRHTGNAFPYLYLAIASILRRERIWFKTINPIKLGNINERILTDHFAKEIDFDAVWNSMQQILQGIYIGFEISLLLKEKKLTTSQVLGLCYDSDQLPEHAGYCAALKHIGFHKAAKKLIDKFWKEGQHDQIKVVERIDDCLRKNSISEKDYFYLQKIYSPQMKEIDFDIKYETFMKENTSPMEYDLAMSFAGEDREIAKKIAEQLKNRGYEVFYDEFEKSKMWGKDLYEYLSNVYKTKARYCLILISENYATKAWTKLERKSAQARAFLDDNEYILPLMLEKVEIPGILPTTGYIDFNTEGLDNVVHLIAEKLNEHGS